MWPRRALAFALALGAVWASGDARVRTSASARAAAPDGVYQPKRKARGVRRVPRGRKARTGTDATAPGATAVAPVPLLDAEGVKRLLARGAPPNDRPLLVNFWATWCEPCREEFPDLIKINRDYDARGLEFAAISVDDPAEANRGVPRFLRELGATMPAYVLNVTDSEPVINAVDPTWGGELPATFLFDRQGRVVYQHKGRVKPAALRAAIDKVTSDK
ncbi:MAG TPA: TlpA disulfide reductase family protein [Pyrinomonadaceae bacterium]